MKSNFKIGDKVLASDGMGRQFVATINDISGDWYLVGCDYMLDHEFELAPINCNCGWV